MEQVLKINKAINNLQFGVQTRTPSKFWIKYEPLGLNYRAS